jgi:periplasmic protein TonB
VDKNTAEQEIGQDMGGEMISGGGMNPAMLKGRPVPDGSGEFSLKQVDQPPTPTWKIDPEFPLMARRLGIGGKVVIKFLVKADGNVTQTSIVEVEPKEIFEQNALEAIREWRFNPGRFYEKAVATWVVLPIQFRLTR